MKTLTHTMVQQLFETYEDGDISFIDILSQLNKTVISATTQEIQSILTEIIEEIDMWNNWNDYSGYKVDFLFYQHTQTNDTHNITVFETTKSELTKLSQFQLQPI